MAFGTDKVFESSLGIGMSPESPMDDIPQLFDKFLAILIGIHE